MTRLLYRPLGMLFGVAGGIAAGLAFKQLWKVAFHEPQAPQATEAGRSWREVLIAATVQGAVYGLIKAAVDRGGATAFQKMSGVWPGKEDSRSVA